MQEPLEQYVETVRTGLKQLSADEREKEITELRQHLESLVVANKAEGESEEIATVTALRQFDAARRVGVDLGKTGLKGRLRHMPEFVAAVLVCITLQGLTSPVFQALRAAIAPPLGKELAATPEAAIGIKISQLVFVSNWTLILLSAGLLFLGLGHHRLKYMLRTRPILQEAVCWSLLTSAMSFIVWCWLLALNKAVTNSWSSMIYFVLPTLLVLLRPTKTASGVGVAAAIVSSLPSYILSIAISVQFWTLPAQENAPLWMLTARCLGFYTPVMLLCFLPMLVISISRIRLEPGTYGTGRTKIVLR